jgi:hypothetical protein
MDRELMEFGASIQQVIRRAEAEDLVRVKFAHPGHALHTHGC